MFFASLCFAQETSSTTDEQTVTGEGSEFLILSELALGVGWPGYQLYNVNFGFQKDAFGVNFRGSWTELGPYVSMAGRYYTPIPIPVPTFVSLGAGYFSGSPTGLATLGAQIPFGVTSPFRATIEAGASIAPGFNSGIEILPTFALTIGYTFFIDTTPLSEEEKRERDLARSRPANCIPTEPDFSKLGSAFSKALDNELKRAKVRYAVVYRLNSWSYDVKNKEESGNSARWTGTWRAKITEVLTGNESSGNGDFSVNFGWNGCSWSVNYSLN